MRAAAARRVAAVVAAAAVGLAGAAGLSWGQSRELGGRGALLDRVAAVVNEGVVLHSELEEQLSVISARLREQRLEPPAQNVLRQQVLERLVLQEIQAQRAERAGIKVPDEQLNRALQEVAERNGLTLSQLPGALGAQGIEYAGYRESMRRELTLTLLRQRDVLARITVTPRELEQFLERQRRLPAEGSEYDVSHILIAVPQAATPEQLQAAEARAEEIYRRAQGGEEFARLAVAYSNSQTALEGGRIGWRKGAELPTVLAEQIVQLAPGQLGAPLRTASGFHLVRLNAVRGAAGAPLITAQVHARHILLKPNEIQDEATVRQRLEALRARILGGEDFAGLAATLSQDPGSATEGGDLGWSSPQSFVPEFAQVLEGLEEGELSAPFRTPYGWHLVQLLGRREFDATDEVRRQRAFAQLRESKAEEETELWLRRLRDEAYVEYKM